MLENYLNFFQKKRLGKTGISRESAQLRVIREYIARLHSSDFLCALTDLEYMDGLGELVS